MPQYVENKEDNEPRESNTKMNLKVESSTVPRSSSTINTSCQYLQHW